jgi:hypothetical protein
MSRPYILSFRLDLPKVREQLMNKAIQQAIELAREGKNLEAYEVIEQELKLSPGNGVAWAIRARLATNNEDRLAALEQASELASTDLERAWTRREIERAEAMSGATRPSAAQMIDPFPGDPVPSPHELDITFMEDDTDHSMKTQAIDAVERKPRRRGCLTLLIAVVVLVIIAVVASVFLVPSLRQMLPIGAGPAAVVEELAASGWRL